jgi:hypothetical protein
MTPRFNQFRVFIESTVSNAILVTNEARDEV